MKNEATKMAVSYRKKKAVRKYPSVIHCKINKILD